MLIIKLIIQNLHKNIRDVVLINYIINLHQ